MSDNNNKEPELRPPTLVAKEKKDRPDEPKVGDPVDVNSNLTPITRQEVHEVTADQWDKMSVPQLHDQLHIMENRLLYAQSLGHDDLYKQVLAGVNVLKALIIQRTPDEIKLV
jgi:hypothetical protein